MTEQEILNKYQIPKDILREYHDWKLCDAVKLVMDEWQYTDVDIERLSDIMVLHEMGFDTADVKKFMELLLKGDSTKQERMNLLNSQRSKILDEIHYKERQIERMDYLRNEMRKQERVGKEL